MISVNQGIGTSVPEKLEKGGGHMMCLVKGIQREDLTMVYKGVDTIEGTMDLNLRL